MLNSVPFSAILTTKYQKVRKKNFFFFFLQPEFAEFAFLLRVSKNWSIFYAYGKHDLKASGSQKLFKIYTIVLDP